MPAPGLTTPSVAVNTYQLAEGRGIDASRQAGGRRGRGDRFGHDGRSAAGKIGIPAVDRRNRMTANGQAGGAERGLQHAPTAVSVPLPRVVAPSLKSTAPLGAAEAWPTAATVAVNRTAWPATADAADVARLVVDAACPTASVNGAELLGRKWPSRGVKSALIPEET